MHQRASGSTLACRRAGTLNGDDNHDAKAGHPTERPISCFFKEPQGNRCIVFPSCRHEPSSPHRRHSHSTNSGLSVSCLPPCRTCLAVRVLKVRTINLKQVGRAQECRQLQEKLVGDQPLTPERSEKIANIMEGAGCTARLRSAVAGIPPRFPVQR